MKKSLATIAIAVIASLAAPPVANARTVAPPQPTKVTHPSWSRDAVIYEVNMRQYTPEGTFKAFEAQLPRLKDLGVDILWLMPIHPISEKNRKGSLGSYYAVKDYTAVNPEYGTMDDFRSLVNAAHAKGMKVILDWVPNHSGCDNVWVTEHPSWYERNDKGEMYGPYDWTDVFVFDYSNPEMRRGMIDALKFWLTDVGVDGFRCDVAMEVPTDFWNEARPQLQAVKPDLFMLAEASVPELQVEGFDMGYNWPMKDLFSEIAATAGQYTYSEPGKPARTFPATYAARIDSLVLDQKMNYPADTYLMNMITNHDLNSWEGTEFDRLGNLAGAFAVLSYTLPGMPLIYTGQETGLNRAFEFFDKDTAPTWEPRNEYFAFYKALNELKHTHKALRAGDGPDGGGAFTVYPTTSRDIFVFSRDKGDDVIYVAVNLGRTDTPVSFTGRAPLWDNGFTDYFTGITPSADMTLKPGQYLIFTK